MIDGHTEERRGEGSARVFVLDEKISNPHEEVIEDTYKRLYIRCRLMSPAIFPP